MLKRINIFNNYIQPKYIKYNFIKLHLDYNNESFKNSLSFKPSDITNAVINNNLLDNLIKQYNRDVDLSYYNEQAKNNIELIEKSLINNKFKDDIIQDIYNNTFYTNNFYTWNITNLVRQYQISSFDVFFALISDSTPFGMGAFDHKKELMNYNEIKNNFYRNSYVNYVDFDYCNGIAIKNSFPLNINLHPLELKMTKYNDRNNNSGYQKIINLLINNFDKRTNEFKRYEITELKEHINYQNNKISKNLQFTFYNKDNKLKNTIIDDKKQNFYNHRNDYDNKSTWIYQTIPQFEKYIKNNLDKCNLTDYFNYSNNISINQDIKNISVVNCLIYGKTNIKYRIIDRLFNLIRFAEYYDNNYHCVQLDNFVLKYYNDYNDKRYEISWRDDNINDLKFSITDKDKLFVSKHLIQLMNEVEPQYLNFNNYYEIGTWYSDNNYSIQTINNCILNENKRIDTEKILL